MNREIKFRAWWPSQKIMLDRTLFDHNWYHTPDNDTTKSRLARPINKIDERIFNIMQFIGLKDENGKEIYEGDIVKFLYKDDTVFHINENIDIHRIGLVIWSNKSCCFYIFCPIIMNKEINKNENHIIEDCIIEVIGNVHQLPKSKEENK